MYSSPCASSTSIHGMINDVQWNAALIGGTLLRDWVANAMSDPDGVIDKIATGTIGDDRPGVPSSPEDEERDGEQREQDRGPVGRLRPEVSCSRKIRASGRATSKTEFRATPRITK